MPRGASSRNHVLDIPICVTIIRIIELLFAIVLLGLSAYGVSKLCYDGLKVTLFTSIATIIVTVYVVVATEFATVIYNYWAILGLDITLVILWLISFSITASNAHQFNSSYNDIRYIGKYYLGFNPTTYRNTLIVCAIFGAIEFVMFIATLVFTAVYLHRHRKAGGHCMPHPHNVGHNVEMKRGIGAPHGGQIAPTQELGSV